MATKFLFLCILLASVVLGLTAFLMFSYKKHQKLHEGGNIYFAEEESVPVKPPQLQPESKQNLKPEHQE